MAKYALLVGINYTGTKSELRGCINDVEAMRNYLVSKRGYSVDHITVLTDHTSVQPTGANIMAELEKLVQRSCSSDTAEGAAELWFHYSGHGSQTRDHDNDEDDGHDETIVPLDYRQHGMITDDQLHDCIEKLSDSCQLYCVMDCCHSGTILDLKYQYRSGNQNGVENINSKVKGNVLMVSGCMDTQTSADTRIDDRWSGAMTKSYLECIRDGISCEELLHDMRVYLKTRGYLQSPQLCASAPITDHRKW